MDMIKVTDSLQKRLWAVTAFRQLVPSIGRGVENRA